MTRSSDLATDVGVTVVHHRGDPEVLRTCLALLRSALPTSRVVIVSTGGHAPAADAARRWSAELIEVPNVSYASAVNAGLAALGDRPFLAFMNDDVEVGHGTFPDLVWALRSQSGAGAAGPVALDARWRVQRFGLPYRLAQRGAMAGPPEGRPVAWLPAHLTVLTRQAYAATGGMDESFRFFNEDIDLGLRLRRLGYASLLVPTYVRHLGGSSTPDHPAFTVEGRRGGFLVTRRHSRWPTPQVLRAYLALESALRVVVGGPRSRAAGRGIWRMAVRDDWDRSPFGPTLDDR